MSTTRITYGNEDGGAISFEVDKSVNKIKVTPHTDFEGDENEFAFYMTAHKMRLLANKLTKLAAKLDKQS
jgi:hypothetical protein